MEGLSLVRFLGMIFCFLDSASRPAGFPFARIHRFTAVSGRIHFSYATSHFVAG